MLALACKDVADVLPDHKAGKFVGLLTWKPEGRRTEGSRVSSWMYCRMCCRSRDLSLHICGILVGHGIGKEHVFARIDILNDGSHLLLFGSLRAWAAECRVRWQVRGTPFWSLNNEANIWDGKSTFKFDSQGRINTHIIDDKTFATFWRNVSLWNYLAELLAPAPEAVCPLCPGLSSFVVPRMLHVQIAIFRCWVSGSPCTRASGSVTFPNFLRMSGIMLAVVCVPDNVVLMRSDGLVIVGGCGSVGGAIDGSLWGLCLSFG